MMHRHTISFRNALRGAVNALSTQPNYKIHIFLSLLALIGAYVYRISYGELLVILVLITVGLTIETMNTAIEQATDAIDLSKRDDIRLAKDISAGAMLIFAAGAFLIACIIFVPKIFI